MSLPDKTRMMAMAQMLWGKVSAKQRLRDAYGGVFGRRGQPLAPEVAAVLADLRRFCRAEASCFDADPQSHALLEGRREVWLRIRAMTNLTDAMIEQLTEAEYGGSND